MAFKLIEKDKYIYGFCEDILEEVFEELEMKNCKHATNYDLESDEEEYDDKD